MQKNSEERISLSPFVKALSIALGPELLHRLWLSTLRLLPKRLPSYESLKTKTKIGMLRSPIGLAAGYDKTGRYGSYLSKLGFGYIVLGSVTFKERRGNPKPRIAYRPRDLAVVNAMGLPNPGIEKFLKNLKLSKDCKYLISIAGDSIDEFIECYRVSQRFFDGVEINISCPTHEACMRMRDAQTIGELARALHPLKERPTYLKLPPPSDDFDLENAIRIASRWIDEGMDGFTAVNTLPVEAKELALGRGGLSGRPLKKIMLKTVKALRLRLGDGFEIHASGGIMTGSDAAEALAAGANTVQIMTAILYRGPYVALKIAKELVEHIHFQRTHTSIDG